MKKNCSTQIHFEILPILLGVGGMKHEFSFCVRNNVTCTKRKKK